MHGRGAVRVWSRAVAVVVVLLLAVAVPSGAASAKPAALSARASGTVTVGQALRLSLTKHLRSAEHARTFRIVWGDGATSHGKGLPSALTHTFRSAGHRTITVSLTTGQRTVRAKVGTTVVALLPTVPTPSAVSVPPSLPTPTRVPPIPLPPGGSPTPSPSPDPVLGHPTRHRQTLGAGSNFVCRIEQHGGVSCWGRDQSGELGDGATMDEDVPVAVHLPPGVSAISLAAGAHHACAVTSSGSVLCWGEDVDGQLGDDDESQRNKLEPVQAELPEGRTAVAITAGWSHTCAVLDDGEAVCWGNNGFMQLGHPSNVDAIHHVDLPAGRSAVDVSASPTGACALLDDGEIACWGVGEGLPDLAEPTIVALPPGRSAVQVSAGDGKTCVILDDRSLACTDGGAYDEAGADIVVLSLPAGRTASSVSAGEFYFVVTLDDGEVLRSAGGALTAVVLLPGTAAADTVAGGVSCAALVDGRTSCWGGNGYGELGNGHTAFYDLPQLAAGVPGQTVRSLAAGSQATCAVVDDGSVRCWGQGLYSQLGFGAQLSSSFTPVQVDLPAGRQAVQVAAGTYAMCARLDDGSVDCWGGSNPLSTTSPPADYGYQPTAVALPQGRTATAVALGADDGLCVLLDDGSVSCADARASLAPEPLPAGRLAVEVARGYEQMCAVLDDGSVDCWGLDGFGQAGGTPGPNATVDAPTPVALPPGRTALHVSAGFQHTCAMLDDRSVVCWGDDQLGQLGDDPAPGAPTSTGTPTVVRLPTGARAESISAGGSSSCAVLSGGSTWCWGLGPNGTADPTQERGPVVVPDGRHLVSASVNRGAFEIPGSAYSLPEDRHSCGVLDDGSVVCWGWDLYGQLGIDPGWAPTLVIS